MQFLADPGAIVRRVVAEVSLPPPPIDLNAWAVRNVVFGSESPLPGPYDPGKFPFFRRILEVASPDDPTGIIALRKSAQLGGTILAQIIVLGLLDEAPQPMLYVHPIDSNAKKWKRNKLARMVKQIPRMERALQPTGARTGNSAMYWERRDGRGFLQLAGANSPSQLSMDSFPYGIHDDYSKWAPDNGAGDPAGQADSRTKAFLAFGGKILKIGTPLAEPGCRISEIWRQGTRERWTVPCPACGGEQSLEWENMLAALDEADPDDAHFTCIHCGARIEEAHRDWMNRRGRWVAENPGAHIASFYLWGAISPLERWSNIARAWLKARGRPEAEQTFLNDNVGEAWATATAAPDWAKVRERAEAMQWRRGVVPAGFYMLTLGCDCQIDRIEVQVVAWGPRLRRAVVDHLVIPHHISEAAAGVALSNLLRQEWPAQAGKPRKADRLAIDGNAWTDQVHAWARGTQSSRVMVVRGSRFDDAPPLAKVNKERTPEGTIVKAQRLWFHVGVSRLKGSLYANLKKTDPLEQGFIGFVAELEDEFYRQFTSEVRTPIRRRDGTTDWRWVPLSGVRQEALDCHLYAEAAARHAKWNVHTDQKWEELAAWLEPAGPPPPPLFAALEPPPPLESDPDEYPGLVVRDADIEATLPPPLERPLSPVAWPPVASIVVSDDRPPPRGRGVRGGVSL